MKLLSRLTETADNPLSKLIAFKALFALASEDYNRVFEIYLKSLEEEISYDELKELMPFRMSYHFFFKFNLTPDGCRERDINFGKEAKDRFMDRLHEFGAVQDFERYKSAIKQLPVLTIKDLGKEQKKYQGIIDHGDLLCELFKELTPENRQSHSSLIFDAAKWHLFMDYLNKLEPGRKPGLIDIRVDILEDTGILVDSFKSFIKDKTRDIFKNILKQEKVSRHNTPDFNLWELYLAAYLLKEKQVKASLLNSKWPKKILNRQETANLLFKENADVQRLDRYVRKAKNLIEDAVNNEGIFKSDLHPSTIN